MKSKLNIDEMFELLYKLKRQREKDGTADVIEFYVRTDNWQNTKHLLEDAGFEVVKVTQNTLHD